MFLLASKLQSYNLQATDDELGKVKDVYFDDKQWKARYLVVDTMKWLPGKKVLISPASIDAIDRGEEVVTVTLSKEKVKNAPHKNEDEPISEQEELNLVNYYGWPNYWGAVAPWGGFAYHSEIGIPYKDFNDENTEQQEGQQKKYHLRSVDEIKGDITGYSVKGLDNDIGNVRDFVLDVNDWSIAYLVVETGKLLTGNFVLIATDWVHDIKLADKSIFVDVRAEDAKQAADFDFEQDISKDYETKIYTTFGKDKKL